MDSNLIRIKVFQTACGAQTLPFFQAQNDIINLYKHRADIKVSFNITTSEGRTDIKKIFPSNDSCSPEVFIDYMMKDADIVLLISHVHQVSSK